jgi:hypothetical protein
MFTTSETHDLLVIDCRAASTDLFIDFFEEVGLPEVPHSLDARLTIICPRLQLQHARVNSVDGDAAPPCFEDFRGTIELLDGRSKAIGRRSIPCSAAYLSVSLTWGAL